MAGEGTNLTALWNAAGDNSFGQLGISPADGSIPTPGGLVVENFTSINNGELPLEHSIVDVVKGWSNEDTTYFLGSDGRFYISGRIDRGTGWQQDPELNSAAQVLYDVGLDSALMKDVQAMPIGIEGFSAQIVKQPRLAETIQDIGNIVSDLAEISSRTGAYVQSDGSLWFRYVAADETLQDKKMISSGVTHVVSVEFDTVLLFLWNGKLYQLPDAGNVISGQPEQDFLPRNITGGLRFKKLFASLYGRNRFLIDDNDVLFVSGENRFGELGVRTGPVSWTKFVTSSKVDDVYALDTHTFIKRKD
jgi:hypothetical protein